MSDNEAKDQADLTTRKSSRQKTPNSYYKQEIQDARGEPKQKQKQAVPKALTKTKKKQTEKIFSTNPISPTVVSQMIPQVGQFPHPSERSNKQSFSLDPEEQNLDKASDRVEPMDLESNPVSNAPERSELQESNSPSGGDSKKSDQNNLNTSFSDNDDNSNKASIGYQTRKIRKKPKFADENYIDNMPPAKATIVQKKIKPAKISSDPASKKQPKQKASQATGFSLVGGALNLEDLQELATSTGPNQQGKVKVKAANSRKGEGKSGNGNEKKKDAAAKKSQETQNFLNDGLLGLFLDTVNQGEKILPTPIASNENKQHDATHNQSTNIKSKHGNQMTSDPSEHAQQSTHNNSMKNSHAVKSRKGDDDTIKRLHLLEDATTSKKKIKTSKKSAGSTLPPGSQEILQSASAQEPFQRQVIRNGTIFTYPDLNPKSECIVRVERAADKVVLIHSSLEKTELKRVNSEGEEETLKRRADVQQLISQIKQRQAHSQSLQQQDKQVKEKQQEEQRQKQLILKQQQQQQQQMLFQASQQSNSQSQQQQQQQQQFQQIQQVLSRLLQTGNEESQSAQPISVQKTISALTSLINQEQTAQHPTNQLGLSTENITAFKLGVQQLQQKFLAEKATLLLKKAEEDQITQEEVEEENMNEEEEVASKQMNNDGGDSNQKNEDVEEEGEEEEEEEDDEEEVQEEKAEQNDQGLKEVSQEQLNEEKIENQSVTMKPDETTPDNKAAAIHTDGHLSETLSVSAISKGVITTCPRKSSFTAFQSKSQPQGKDTVGGGQRKPSDQIEGHVLENPTLLCQNHAEAQTVSSSDILKVTEKSNEDKISPSAEGTEVQPSGHSDNLPIVPIQQASDFFVEQPVIQ